MLADLEERTIQRMMHVMLNSNDKIAPASHQGHMALNGCLLKNWEARIFSLTKY